MSTMKICPQCLSAIPADAPQGACPKCLLQAGFETRSDVGAAPQRINPPTVEELARDFPQLEIIELLGAGGMGVVYKVRQVALDRIVALKVLPQAADGDPSFADRFSREARALAKLSHPNIVSIFDFGQSNGRFYFLMEFIDGVNLRQMITAQRLSPREALAIVPQVCDALQYAHDQGIVHRDIKPENLLIDRRGRVHIADFGLAKLVGGAPGAQLTQTQHIMGTPHYMAPEQFEKPGLVDHRADIYSLGVVLYEMLTGELPLGRFAPPSAKVQLDVRLDEVVLKTLEKEPERRYQQASEMKTEMEGLGGVPVQNLPPAMRNMFGTEFTSSMHVGSWPLVHIAFGIDPRTGKARSSRGIIAIGSGKATGVVAMGTFARGVFAFGAVALGVFSIGGLAFGLASFAGLALALGFACGGVAIGPLSYGGVAIGIGAFGGVAIGYHALGGMSFAVQDDKAVAREFFSSWRTFFGNSTMVVTMVIFAVSEIVYLGAALWLRRRPSQPVQQPPAAPPEAAAARDLIAPSKLLVIAALLNWLGLLVFAIIAFYLAAGPRNEFTRIAPFVILILMIGSGLILFGAIKMQRLDSIAWGRTAAVLAMIIGPGYIVGWPAGIWSLAVLSRPEVKEAFRKRAAARITPAAVDPSSPAQTK